MIVELSIHTADRRPIRRHELVRAAWEAGWSTRFLNDPADPTTPSTTATGSGQSAWNDPRPLGPSQQVEGLADDLDLAARLRGSRPGLCDEDAWDDLWTRQDPALDDEPSICQIQFEADPSPDTMAATITIYETMGMDRAHLRALRESRSAYHIRLESGPTAWAERLSQAVAQLRGGLWVFSQAGRWAVVEAGDPIEEFPDPVHGGPESGWLLG